MISLQHILKHRKWIIFINIALVFAFLLFCYIYFLRLDCYALFSSCYHSSLELPLAIILTLWSLTILFIALIKSNAYPILNKSLQLFNLIASLIVFVTTLLYHLNYNGHPQKIAFFDYEPVTPFHLQLASTFFNYTVLLNFILLFFSGSIIIRMLSFLLSVSAFVIIHHLI